MFISLPINKLTTSLIKTFCWCLLRRSTNYISFSEDEVHRLPGFPLNSKSEAHLLAVVAFYVNFPPGVALGSIGVIEKNTLMKIVKGSRADIESSINRTIISVDVYTVDPSPTSTDPTSTVSPAEERSYTLYYIIGGCVGGAGLLLFIIITVLLCR